MPVDTPVRFPSPGKGEDMRHSGIGRIVPESHASVEKRALEGSPNHSPIPHRPICKRPRQEGAVGNGEECSISTSSSATTSATATTTTTTTTSEPAPARQWNQYHYKLGCTKFICCTICADEEKETASSKGKGNYSFRTQRHLEHIRCNGHQTALRNFAERAGWDCKTLDVIPSKFRWEGRPEPPRVKSSGSKKRLEKQAKKQQQPPKQQHPYPHQYQHQFLPQTSTPLLPPLPSPQHVKTAQHQRQQHHPHTPMQLPPLPLSECQATSHSMGYKFEDMGTPFSPSFLCANSSTDGFYMEDDDDGTIVAAGMALVNLSRFR